jgi:hypothetical protein
MLEHALDDLLDWEGTRQLQLLHSSDDVASGTPTALVLHRMFHSIAHRGPTVTVLQNGGGGKAVGVYLERP